MARRLCGHSILLLLPVTNSGPTIRCGRFHVAVYRVDGSREPPALRTRLTVSQDYSDSHNSPPMHHIFQ